MTFNESDLRIFFRIRKITNYLFTRHGVRLRVHGLQFAWVELDLAIVSETVTAQAEVPKAKEDLRKSPAVVVEMKVIDYL